MDDLPAPAPRRFTPSQEHDHERNRHAPPTPDTAQAAKTTSPELTKIRQAIGVLAGIAVAHGQVSEEQQAQIAELLN